MLSMKKDKYVDLDKFVDHSNEHGENSNCFSTVYLNHLSTNYSTNQTDQTTNNQTAPNRTSFRNQPTNDHQQSSSPELCEKIRSSLGHLTEEFKEKFKKKKNRSTLFVNRKNESNNSSDQEENEKQNRCVTRVKIKTSDENNFVTFNHLNSQYFGQNNQHHYQNSSSFSNNLSQNNHCNSTSQNNLPESRSPFVNRALPPVPNPPLPTKSERDYQLNDQFNRSFNDLKASHSRDSEKSNENLAHKKTNNSNGKLNSSSRNNSDDDELNLTNCFKLYKDKELKKCSNKIRNIKQFLPKKYSHPPPHLHSKTKVVQFDDDDEEEDNDEETNSNQLVQSSLINLNSNLIHSNINGVDNHQPTGSHNMNSNNMNSSMNNNNILNEETKKMMDYAESIEKVKDCGWYWGCISGEKAEKLLENEPEGSFIVRDSSDENYIFSLTFKLKSDIIHVRIEHDQGNFSFGSLQKFSSRTIVDFIKDAVEYSRSGRYLFFLHRLPVVGPMRVQLLNPVSRFRNVQSLKHLCRFIILKHVRRDLLQSLPLPDNLIIYLNATNYFVESNTFS